MIRFQVTDAQGKPTAAAIGVIVVDEAVYALQDLQPGLEKTYFTLQEELLKPQAQIKLSPGETIDNLVIQPVLPAPHLVIVGDSPMTQTLASLAGALGWRADLVRGPDHRHGDAERQRGELQPIRALPVRGDRRCGRRGRTCRPRRRWRRRRRR